MTTAGQLNGYEVKYIANDADFEVAIKQLQEADAVALDLEFDDNRYTYGLTLCLIQIADRETCYLIDPFGISSLRPLWDIVDNPAVQKIIHSASNDIILLKILGCQPQNILDTELAAKVLNYGRTSFANMMEVVFNISIDKAHQVSNWNNRPLSEEQLIYAANDVVYLLELRNNLVSEIEKLNRQSWLDEECRLLGRIEQKDQTDRYLKLRGADRLTFYELYILKQLYYFREELAIKFNKPTAMVIPNETLVNLVIEPITDFKEWQNTKGLMGRIKDHQTFKQLQEVFHTAHQEALAANISHERPPRSRRPDYLFAREEVDKRKLDLQPLKNYIIEKYGENVVSLILPQGILNEYAENNIFEVKKQYARQIVEQAVQDLQLKITIN